MKLTPRSAEIAALAFIPVCWRAGVPVPLTDKIMWTAWPRDFEPRTFDLWFREKTFQALAYSFVVLMLKMMSAPMTALADILSNEPSVAACQALVAADADTVLAIAHRRQQGGPKLIDVCQFSLTRQLQAAADTAKPASSLPAICFALGSCQPPAGLPYELPAGASYQTLLGDTMRA